MTTAKEEEVCITPEELQSYQTEINALTVHILDSIDGQGIGVIVPATMNVLLNMFMEVKRRSDGGTPEALSLLVNVRKMVDYIESQVKGEPAPSGATH